MLNFRPQFVKLCIGTFLVLTPLSEVRAAPGSVWLGTESNLWNNPNNWDNGVPPENYVAIFSRSAETSLNPTILKGEQFSNWGIEISNDTTDVNTIHVEGQLDITTYRGIKNFNNAGQSILVTGTLNLEDATEISGNNDITLTSQGNGAKINFFDISFASTKAHLIATNKGAINFLDNSYFQGDTLSASALGVITLDDESRIESGALNLDNASIYFYDNTSFNSTSLSSSAINGSTINFSDSARSTGKLFANGSTINFYKQSQVTDGLISIQNNSVLNFYNYSQAVDDAVIELTSSIVNFKNDAQFLRGKLTITNSTANFYNWAAVNDGILQATQNSEFNLYDHAAFRAGALSVENDSSANFYDHTQFTGGSITADSTFGDEVSINFHDHSVLNGGSLHLTNGSRGKFLDESRFIAGNILVDTVSQLSFQDHAKAEDVTIHANHASVIFTGSSQFNNSLLDMKSVSTARFELDGQFGRGSEISLDENGSTANVVTFAPPTDGTFVGEVVGNSQGIVRKDGPGVLKLVTDSPDFLGVTQLTSEITYLNALWGGNVQVDQAILRGEGTIKGNLRLSDGIQSVVEPGNSPGTLTVLGNTIFGDTSSLIIDIDDQGKNGFLDVGGTLTISETDTKLLVKSEDPAVLNGSSYHVAHSDGALTGNFATYDATNPLLLVQGVVGAHDINVNVSVPIAAFVNNSNQLHVLEQLATNADPSQDLNTVLTNLNLRSGDAATHALDSLTGEQYANLVQVTQQSTRRFLNRLHIPGRLDRDCSCSECFVWTEFQGGQSTFSNDNHIKGLDVDHYAFTIGTQKDIDENWATGAAFAYERDQLNFNLNGSGHGNTYQGAIYGVYSECCGYILGDLLLGYSEYDIHRKVQFGDEQDEVRRRLHGSTHVWDFTGNVEAGLNYTGSCFAVQPFVGFEAGTYRLNDFKEHDGDSLNLKFGKRNINNFDGRIGAHLLMSLPCDLQFGADLAYRHRFTSTRGRVEAQFREFGDEFTVVGVNTKRDGVEWAAWLASDIGCNVDLYVETSGEHYEGLTDWSLAGGLVYTW